MTRRRYPNSFSLVEMMVAIAVFAILTLVLASSLSTLIGEWTFGQAKNERRNSGQAVLDRISRDLRQMSLPAYRYNTNSLQFVINPSTLASNYELPQAAFWQAPVSTDGTSSTSTGNLAIVGYFVQWVNGTPCLCRLLINPSSSTNYPIYSAPTNWINEQILTNNAAATSASGYAGLLANNVLGIWFQTLDGQGNPIQQATSSIQGEAFDSRQSYAFTNYLYTNAGAPIMATNQAPCLPCAIQVAIIVVDSRTAQRLTGSEKPAASSLTGNFWSDVQGFYNALPAAIKKGAEIQTTTVEIAGGPH